MNTRIVIKQFTSDDKSKVADKWQLLEQSCNPTIFLSWQWIGNWLDMVTDKLFLVEAYRDDKVVGLAIFVEKKRKLFGLFPIKQWWLHRTGEQKQDQIWIEYNDFLLDESCAKQVRKKMIQAIANFDSSVKEVNIGLSTQDTLDYFTESFEETNLLGSSFIKTYGYLASLSSYGEDYFTSLISKNTRKQISRSTKILQSQGELNFQVFSNPKKLIELYPKIASIHIDKWQRTKEGSGFSNPLFEGFHKSMMINNTDSIIQIAVLTLNELELGYLVNFVYNNKVYFYLSALQQNSDNKVKIGMTLHSEAIKYYSAQGIESYDFLGGDARYKKSLSDKRYELEMKCFYRNELLLRLESWLKTFKKNFISVLCKRLG